MSKLLQRLNMSAVGVLGVVLSCVLLAQIKPVVRPADQAPVPDDRTGLHEPWPRTLEVYPSHPGDPVKLVAIMKGGMEIQPGTYILPQIAGDISENGHAFNDWLKDVTFVLKSQTPKNIVSVGLSVVFPERDTGLDCVSINGHIAPSAWCDAHPTYCDGGCPALISQTLHWGRIPARAASAMEARYRAEGGQRILLQGNEPLQFGPGEQIALSLAGRGDGFLAHTDPRHPFTNVVNGLVFNEGIDEARDTEPCRDRRNSKIGCAFSKVSKFNIGLGIVYFEDGTIWGNYGYGYAVPNPDGIYTRLEARGSRTDLDRTQAPN